LLWRFVNEDACQAENDCCSCVRIVSINCSVLVCNTGIFIQESCAGLPEGYHKAAKVLAKKDHISINQLVTLALAEKIATLGAEKYLSKRAKNGNCAH
jgi:hypothetical protein